MKRLVSFILALSLSASAFAPAAYAESSGGSIDSGTQETNQFYSTEEFNALYGQLDYEGLLQGLGIDSSTWDSMHNSSNSKSLGTKHYSSLEELKAYYEQKTADDILQEYGIDSSALDFDPSSGSLPPPS